MGEPMDVENRLSGYGMNVIIKKKNQVLDRSHKCLGITTYHM